MEYWKVNKVTGMSKLFHNVKFEIPDISKWNVDNVKNNFSRKHKIKFFL